MFRTVSSQVVEEQHKGMCSVPKLALNVMACQVVQLLQLTKSSVVPLSYCVPRKVILPFFAPTFWYWGERQLKGFLVFIFLIIKSLQ